MDPSEVGKGAHRVKDALAGRHPQVLSDILLTDVERVITCEKI